MLNSIRFLHLEVLYLLLLVPLLGLLHWRRLRYLTGIREQLGVGSQLSKVSRTSSLPRSWTVAVLSTLVVFGLILALARPQILQERTLEVIRKLDIVFLLDTSPSMQAEDFLPSRLDRARQFVKEIIIGESLIGRVGLLSFSGSSIILSYLTSDSENVLFYLDYLAEQQDSSLGTDIGSAIISGIQVMDQGLQGDERLEANRQILVMLSDGEDHGEELTEALRQVVQQSLRIYTIGIGSEAGGFIPVNQQDGSVEYLKDLHGVRIVSRLNERTLRRIAQTTGGRFYRAYEESEIGRALREIVSLERELIGYRKQREWFDLYFPLLVGTAVLFLGAWGMERD